MITHPQTPATGDELAATLTVHDELATGETLLELTLHVSVERITVHDRSVSASDMRSRSTTAASPRRSAASVGPPRLNAR
jgi:hypothetical protein